MSTSSRRHADITFQVQGFKDTVQGQGVESVRLISPGRIFPTHALVRYSPHQE